MMKVQKTKALSELEQNVQTYTNHTTKFKRLMNDRAISNKERQQAYGKYILYAMKRQLTLEQIYAPMFKRCTDNLTFKLQEIDKLEEQQNLQKYLTLSFNQATIVESIFCSLDSQLNVSDMYSYEASNEVTKFFNNLRRIGAESVEGFALFAGVGIAKDLFVIKVPQNPKYDNLFHEYFVGISCLNKLRRHIPTFSYVFGAFTCSPPIINKDKSVSSFCSSKNNGVNYVIFEKVNGPSFRDVVKNCTLTQYLSYMIQVIIGLKFAHRHCDFTHYDLHDENVLLRDIPTANKKWVYVPYDYNNTTLYIKTDRIPTIIDYGRTHVKVKINSQPMNFGYFSDINGLFVDKSRPLYDIYKLMMFTLGSAYEQHNDGLLNEAIPLANIWTTDVGSNNQPYWPDVKNLADFHIKLKIEHNKYYQLSPEVLGIEKELGHKAFDKTLDLIDESYGDITSQIIKEKKDLLPTDQIFDCEKMRCVSLSKFKKDITEL